MSFQDAQLAHAMEHNLIRSRVMTQAQFNVLIGNPTEVHVANTIGPNVRTRFGVYWHETNAWMNKQALDVAGNLGVHKMITARVIPGREPANVASIAIRVLYDDAFLQTLKHFQSDNFSTNKAVAGALRFIKKFNYPDPDPESDSDGE